MEKLLVCAIVAGLAGSSSLLFEGIRAMPPKASVEVRLATDGAYRDGLFVGKLRREAQTNLLPPVGRWSTPQDRTAFLQGYRQGLENEGSGK